jgi:phospholipase C
VIVQPYFDMAKDYGFANYMFQTSEGPSFPAHQFLFSGTSSPIYPPATTSSSSSDFMWFAGENLEKGTSSVPDYGCLAAANAAVLDVNPNNGSEAAEYTPPYAAPANTAGYPCYDHNTMADLLNNQGISWRYYANPSASTDTPPFSDLWTAPNAIYHICQPSLGSNNSCQGQAFIGSSTSQPNVWPDFQIMTDLGAAPGSSCGNLPQVSWVIPDGNWSDHPGTQGHDGGPSWVSAIVNAVGGYKNSGDKLDNQCDYWNNTVILVTWDDWGGFFDDIDPITTMSPSNNGLGGYNGTTNGTYYVYGFRVPLLVISTFATPGYMSGANISSPQCPNYYCHDFGSILNFIEYAFGLPSIGPTNWPYADSFVEDKGLTSATAFSLYDFFGTVPFQTTYSFTKITTAKYGSDCFFSAANAKTKDCFPGYPADPDDD